MIIVDDYCEQNTLRNKLSGLEYLVSGQYCKCDRNWCPEFPVLGRHELNVIISPKTATEYIVIKVRKWQKPVKFRKYNLQYFVHVSCLQCFDAVGWAAGRASGL